MKIISEFKDFAMRGNVIDMAVGIIIGAAFGKIVSSLVQDVVTPPLGLLVGGVDFTNLVITLKPATETAAAVVIKYGEFLQATFDFIIVAAAIFAVIKLMNNLKKKEEEKEEAPKKSDEVKLLEEIRDSLKK